jgi:hypothetical protein
MVSAVLLLRKTWTEQPKVRCEQKDRQKTDKRQAKDREITKKELVDTDANSALKGRSAA